MDPPRSGTLGHTPRYSIGNHTHSSPIWEIIVLAILKIVRGEAEYDF